MGSKPSSCMLHLRNVEITSNHAPSTNITVLLSFTPLVHSGPHYEKTMPLCTTIEKIDEPARSPQPAWKKVLWHRQPFPDNHVPSSFLSELKDLRRSTYIQPTNWQLCERVRASFLLCWLPCRSVNTSV
jgi:hypothetical protein